MATFTIPILLDSPVEADETVILTLSSPTGGASLGSPSSAVLTIRNDTADRDGPRVTALRAISARRGLGSIVITFNEDLDPARAENLLNYGYSVRTLGRDRRLGTRDDLIVGLRSAVYDPITRTVTLRTDGVIHSNIPFVVIINEATNIPGAGVGVSDLFGNLLDGDDERKGRRRVPRGHRRAAGGTSPVPGRAPVQDARREDRATAKSPALTLPRSGLSLLRIYPLPAGEGARRAGEGPRLGVNPRFAERVRPGKKPPFSTDGPTLATGHRSITLLLHHDLGPPPLSAA